MVEVKRLRMRIGHELRRLRASRGPRIGGDWGYALPKSACRLRPARGKSKAERGENLVRRTVWKDERSVCTHFSNQARCAVPAGMNAAAVRGAGYRLLAIEDAASGQDGWGDGCCC